jgi:ABC-type transporter lipoprotein component MlaA
MNSKYMILKDIEGLEDFSNYAVDMNGNVWAIKYKRPKLRKPVLNNNQLSVKLLDDYKKMRTFYIQVRKYFIRMEISLIIM